MTAAPSRGVRCASARAAVGSVLAVVGWAAAPAAADVLTQYQFGTTGQETTNEASAAFSPSVVSPNITATAVTDPQATVGIEISSAATAPPTAPVLRLDPQGNSADPNAAQANNKYFQFSIAANLGVDLDLTSLTFNVQRGGGGTPRGFFIRTSVDGFTAAVAAVGTPALSQNATFIIGNDVNTVRPTFTAVTADLTAPAFQNIQAQPGGAVVFRIYNYSPAAGSSLDFDDITINGTAVAVPEPASAGGLGLAAAGLLARRRRR